MSIFQTLKQRGYQGTDVVIEAIAHTTIWNLKQKEGRCSEKAQDQLVEKVLSEHRETLDKHGFLDFRPKVKYLFRVKLLLMPKPSNPDISRVLRTILVLPQLRAT